MSSEDTPTLINAQEIGHKGGTARAASLSPERRKEIAQKASWSRKSMKNLPKATHTGELHIGDGISISCAVLEDGRRVITQSSMLETLGRNKNPRGRGRVPTLVKEARDRGDHIPVFVAANNLIPFITNNIRASTTSIEFIHPKYGKAIGCEATIIPEICSVYLEAREQGVLTANQKPIAQRCEVIVKALAKVGVVALVDEAVGFPREQAELCMLFNKYVIEELQPWTKRFPAAFFDNLKRIYGMTHFRRTPSFCGHFINKYVYDELGPGLVEELKRVNPSYPNGGRPARHHQHLTDDVGHPELTKQIVKVNAFMSAADNKKEFETLWTKAKNRSE